MVGVRRAETRDPRDFNERIGHIGRGGTQPAVFQVLKDKTGTARTVENLGIDIASNTTFEFSFITAKNGAHAARGWDLSCMLLTGETADETALADLTEVGLYKFEHDPEDPGTVLTVITVIDPDEARIGGNDYLYAAVRNDWPNQYNQTFVDDFSNVSVIPEPSTFVLAAIGLLGLIGFALRRRQA